LTLRLTRVRGVPLAGEALGLGDLGGAEQPHRLHQFLLSKS